MAVPLSRAAKRAARDAQTRPAPTESLADVELRLLLEGLYRQYGLDYRDYSLSTLRRRVRHLMEEEAIPTISALQDRVFHEHGWLERLIPALTVTVTSMFRDPACFRALRDHVIPVLRTYPVVRVWHAGCSTGEEVYSLAILMTQAGLYDRCRIYATDVSDTLLGRARRGVMPLAAMEENARHYLAAGGRGPFSRWYSLGPHGAQLDPALLRNVVFATHNLVTDGSFNEFNLVLCRNVLIYFNRPLQERVHDLLYASLRRFGFLALGSKETVRFTPHEDRYREMPGHVWRKVA